MRARNQVERVIMAFLILSSTIAIFTTIGIVLSLLFEAVRFFKVIPVTEILFGLKWSPQMAIRADQVGASGAFGAVPVFAGTLLISFITMTVAVPIGLLSAIFLSEYAALFTNGDSREPELAGIGGAVMGSAFTLMVTLVLSFPIGVAAAVYLEEFAPKNRWTDLIEVNINNLAAVPSIEYGLLGLVSSKSEMDELVENTLRKAALWDEVKDNLEQPGTGLSGGQQQRLCIARAIAIEPEVVLMDEPCSALDPISTAKIEELMDELRENYTIVIVTHSMQQAARVSQRTAYFHLGDLIEVGETAHIFTSPPPLLRQGIR